MEKDKAPAPRGRSVRGAKRSVLAMFVVLAGAAVATPFLHVEQSLGVGGRTAAWMAGLALEADMDALREQEIPELRRRFRDKVQACTGLSAGTWPLRLDESPGRLTLKYGREVTPALSVDFFALKDQGLTGDFATFAARTETPDGVAQAVLMAGLLGVVAPDRPCPPTPDGQG